MVFIPFEMVSQMSGIKASNLSSFDDYSEKEPEHFQSASSSHFYNNDETKFFIQKKRSQRTIIAIFCSKEDELQFLTSN